MWLEGFANVLSGTTILWLLLGSGIGLVIGVLPALGANFGVVLMLPFTFGMDPATAIIFLCAIHASCNYGDSVTSILVNIPGGPGTVATCWDGYPLAQQGRAGEALGIATFSSFIGGVAVWIVFVLLVKPITKMAFAFGAPEYFALMFMALGLISVASKGETLKGLILGCVGLALSEVGQDEVMGITYRFSYGLSWLEAGFPIVVCTLGIFAISQVIELVEEGGTVAKAVDVKDSILKGFLAPLRRPFTLLRAGSVGAFIGILPALGVGLAGITAYLVEKKYSPEASQFGKGAPAGLVAAEVGKGACVVGDLIPTFTLGVPGSVTGAILLAALIMLGVEPGPRFLLSGSVPYTVFAGLLLTQASFLISGVLLGKWLCRIAYIPITYLAPILTVLVFMGDYADRNYAFDIWLSLAFGVFGYILKKVGYPVVCLVLGLILGPIVEVNFHRSLAISFGSYSIFVTRPIAVGILSITVLFLVGPFIIYLFRRYRKKSPGFFEKALESSAGRRGYRDELVLLICVALTLSIFLYTAQGYTPLVRLFPTIVCMLGLGLTIWRLTTIIYHLLSDRSLSSGPSSSSSRFSLFHGRLCWYWSAAAMIGYALFIYLVGFIIATSLYVLGVVIMTEGYRKWKYAMATGILLGLGVYLFAKTVNLLLPLGLLTGV